MKRHLLVIALVLVVGIGVVILSQGSSMASTDEAVSEGTKTMVFQVDGMTCSLCSKAVGKALRMVEGVESSEVSDKTSRAVVVAREGVSPVALEQAIEGAGYDADLLEVN